ncbi:MAG TPA: ornithine carbamoyltransferase [Thermoanaerobaculia bacterium]|nr:ornithine carbamoyltransferase [Thermoanaerobaculia bacterium]
MHVNHKDLISIHDYKAEEVAEIFAVAAEMKKSPEKFSDALKGKTLGMIFEKSSTRTRVSFEVGIYQLGGTALFLSSRDIQLGRGEPIYDTAKVLSRYLDGIMARTFAHNTVTDLAEYASIPVINGLTDLLHPCQGLTDYFTASEKLGDLKGRKIAYIGDGNNMAHSLMYGAPKVGMDIVIATPSGYAPNAEVEARAKGDADVAGTKITITQSIEEAAKDADIIETDVWASMGQEEEAQKRAKDFEGWMVDQKVMGLAKKGAIFMHCLPAHRGEEVSADVVDSPQSVIYDEAENRLHVQKAIMYLLMKDRRRGA